mgnify:CR=1 FL=1
MCSSDHTSVIDEEAINTTLKSTKEKLSELNKQKHNVTNDLHSLAIEIDDLNFRIDGVDEASLNKKLDECKSLNIQLGAVNLEKQKLSDHISHKLDKMGKLKELEYDPDCKYCMGNVFVKDAIAAKEQINADREKLVELEKKQKRRVEPSRFGRIHIPTFVRQDSTELFEAMLHEPSCQVMYLVESLTEVMPGTALDRKSTRLNSSHT